MATKIFIGGGGDVKIAKKFDSLFFDSLTYNSKVLYIPIAMGTTTNVTERCYDWFTSLVSEHNEDKNIDFELLKDLSQDIKINDYDAVYIGGGNTYRLLNLIKKNNFHKKLESYLSTKGMYYGGSAGGIILGESLLTVSEESQGKYKDSDGLNLLNGYSVFPHFTVEQIQKVKNISQKFGLNILAIPEDSGVIFEGVEKFESVGSVLKINKDEI